MLGKPADYLLGKPADTALPQYQSSSGHLRQQQLPVQTPVLIQVTVFFAVCLSVPPCSSALAPAASQLRLCCDALCFHM
jgi:hypothetical protein